MLLYVNAIIIVIMIITLIIAIIMVSMITKKAEFDIIDIEMPVDNRVNVKEGENWRNIKKFWILKQVKVITIITESLK